MLVRAGGGDLPQALSIPRDTLAQIPWPARRNKINSAVYATGRRR